MQTVAPTLFGAVNSLSEFYKGFSGPFVPFDESLLEYLIVEHGRETIRAFLDRHRVLLDQKEPSVRAFLDATLAAELGFEAVWSPAFGRLAMCALSVAPSIDQVRDAAISMAWSLTAEGVSGEWSASPAQPEPMRLRELVLAPATRFDVEAGADGMALSLTLVGGDRRSLRLLRAGRRWEQADGGAPLTTHRVHDGIIFLTNGVAETIAHSYLADSVIPAHRVDEAIDTHNAAMELMDKCAPGYARWVRRLLRAVIPLESKTGGINSGSSRHEPGVVHASVDCPREGYAEMLVHEVSHQHLYAISRLGPTEDGSDPTLYYSPVKQTGRPIAMILIAYHAFANVLLLGSECLGHLSAGDREYFSLNEEFLRPQVQVLERSLRTTRALTPIGRALWEPLAARLDTMPRV